MKKPISEKQKALALLLIGMSIGCLFYKLNLLLIVCLALLFAYLVWLYRVDFMFSVKPNEIKNEDYIESIKGIINSEDFSMHARHVVSLAVDVYEDYVAKLKKGDIFKSEVEQSVVRNFLQYTKEKRRDIKGLEEDIRKLRYSDLKYQEKKDIQNAHWRMWRYTKDFLWKLEPYTGSVSGAEHFHKKVKHLNGNLTLERALERMCAFHDDHDQTLRELKFLLARYHPDKNKDEKAREIYEKIDLVYRAVSTILKKYESYYGDTIFCDFKMFLNKKLKDITEEEVSAEMMFVYTELRMRRYLEQENVIASIRYKMIAKYREWIDIVDIILEMTINNPHTLNPYLWIIRRRAIPLR